MDAIEPYRLPRTSERISAELHSAQAHHWALISLACDYVNCQPPQPIFVVPGEGLLPQPLPELPPDLKEALRLSSETIGLLERELHEAHERYVYGCA